MYRSKTKRKSGPRTYKGLPVKDAKRPYNWVIAQVDCNKGKPNEPGKCAAAVSLRRTHPDHPKEVLVHRAVTFLIFEDHAVRYTTPHALRDQQLRYDGPNNKFDPGVYTLLPPSPSLIKARGAQHSPPDRKHGDPASPKRRKAARRHIGRAEFHFSGAV
jgi:hypothetical protein